MNRTDFNQIKYLEDEALKLQQRVFFILNYISLILGWL